MVSKREDTRPRAEIIGCGQEACHLFFALGGDSAPLTAKTAQAVATFWRERDLRQKLSAFGPLRIQDPKGKILACLDWGSSSRQLTAAERKEDKLSRKAPPEGYGPPGRHADRPFPGAGGEYEASVKRKHTLPNASI